VANVVSVRALKLLAGALALLGAVSAAAERVPPGTEQEIRERLKPFASLCRAGEDCGGGEAVAATGGARTGEQVYNQFCGTCHAAGIAGAPTLDDTEAWEPRLAQGMDTLWDHTLNGINAMPAKGTCMNCSDEELRAAMDYMVDAVP
jgi:cytochrome c5